MKHHGITQSIQSDSDLKPASDVWKALCTKIDIKHHMTEANWPQANGQAEQTNQAVKQCLRFSHHEGLYWYGTIDVVEMTINKAPICNTSYSPHFLNCGFNRCIIPDLWDDKLSINNPILQTSQQFMDQLNYNWKVAQSAFEKIKTEQNKYYDSKREPANFKIGDLVLFKLPDPLLQRIDGKLASAVCGPFPIVENPSSKHNIQS